MLPAAAGQSLRIEEDCLRSRVVASYDRSSRIWHRHVVRTELLVDDGLDVHSVQPLCCLMDRGRSAAAVDRPFASSVAHSLQRRLQPHNHRLSLPLARTEPRGEPRLDAERKMRRTARYRSAHGSASASSRAPARPLPRGEPQSTRAPHAPPGHCLIFNYHYIRPKVRRVPYLRWINEKMLYFSAGD